MESRSLTELQRERVTRSLSTYKSESLSYLLDKFFNLLFAGFRHSQHIPCPNTAARIYFCL